MKETGTAVDVWTRVETTGIAGLNICTASRLELAAAAMSDCEAIDRFPGMTRTPRLVFDANGHGISMCASSKSFAELMEQADIVHADGGFLVTLSRWIGTAKISERSATTDLIHDIAHAACESKRSFYLFGGTEEINSGCALELMRRYPDLRIAGRRNGFFSAEDEQGIVSEINESGADILWVGLGKPLEQVFCISNRKVLQPAWIVTCGGCFNYITGAYPRAPAWMQYANLEWLHRLVTNPKQLFFRYLTTTPHALWVVMRYAFSSSGKVL